MAAKRLKKDDEMGEYFPTQLYNHLVGESGVFNSKERIVFVDVILGAKGVGKSSLLVALNKYYKGTNQEDEGTILKYYSAPSDIFESDWVGDLAPLLQPDHGKSAVILLDNFQNVCTLSKMLKSRLKQFVKDKLRHPKVRIVLTTSRQGLKVVCDAGIFSHDEALLYYYINPQKDVAEELFKKIYPNFKDDDFRDELLEYFGYVPRRVLLLHSLPIAPVDKRDMLLEELKQQSQGAAIRNLKSDAEAFKDDTRTRNIYNMVMALIAAGADVNLADYRDQLTPLTIPWTMLKTSHDYSEAFPVKFTVRVVGRWCQDACLTYLGDVRAEDLEYTLNAACTLFKDLPGGLGNRSGPIFELQLWSALKRKPSPKIKYYYTDEGSIKDGYLPDSALLAPQQLLGNHITASNRTMVYVPNVKDVDFVIVDENGISHGIQVSVQDWSVKCQKEFYKTKDYNHVYLLTTQSADVGILEKIKDSKFKEAFNNHKLRVVDVSSVLGDRQLTLIRTSTKTGKA